MAGKKKFLFSLSGLILTGFISIFGFQNCAEGFDSTAQSSVSQTENSQELLSRPSVEVYPSTELVLKTIGLFDLTFHKTTGSLLLIRHRTAGILLQSSSGDEGLFSIATPVTNYLPLSLDTANSAMSQNILEDNLPDGRRRLRLIWQNLGGPPNSGKAIRLEQVSIGVIVEIIASPAPAQGLEFRLHLQNRGVQSPEAQKVAVAQVLFPDLRGLRRLPGASQSPASVGAFQTLAFDRTTNPFIGPLEDADRTLFYPMAFWERVLLPTIATDADGFALKDDQGTHLSRVFDYGRHYLGLMTCPGNGSFLTEKQTSGATLFPAEEIMYSRNATGPGGLRVAWRRPLTPVEQQRHFETAGWWFTPIVSLTVSLNGTACP